MASIILLFLCLFIGIGLRKIPAFPIQTPVVLNSFVIYISLPAMALYYMPRVEISPALIFPAAMPWIAFLGAFLIFAGLGKIFGWSRSLIGCLVLTAGLGNTSFVGIPVIEAMYGSDGLKTLVIVDQPGTFVVLSTVGILAAVTYSKGSSNLLVLVKKIIFFPPFIGFVIGFSFALFEFRFPEYIDEVFLKLSATVTPIALVSVGYQLKIEKRSQHWPFLIMGLAYQLILLPALIFFLYVFVFKQSGLSIKVSIIEAAMAPMITAAIIASAYGLKPKLSNMMVGFGIPISFITLIFWYWVVENFV